MEDDDDKVKYLTIEELQSFEIRHHQLFYNIAYYGDTNFNSHEPKDVVNSINKMLVYNPAIRTILDSIRNFYR